MSILSPEKLLLVFHEVSKDIKKNLKTCISITVHSNSFPSPRRNFPQNLLNGNQQKQIISENRTDKEELIQNLH